MFINRCEQCQKRANPPQTHRHSVVECTPSYTFHHIGLDFMDPIPSSNGNKHILLMGGPFSIDENWIYRFGSPHKIHSDQGLNFESKLFKALNQALQVDKTRTTAFRPQSNAAVERMNRTLQSMLAKCINEEQSNWSQQFLYVMMAYRTSVHEYTGYTPHFLVYGQEVCNPIDFMDSNPIDQPPADIHKFVLAREIQFQKAYDSARMALNFNQKRRNALYKKSPCTHPPSFFKKTCYITPLFQSVKHTVFLALGWVRMLSYNASTT